MTAFGYIFGTVTLLAGCYLIYTAFRDNFKQ